MSAMISKDTKHNLDEYVSIVSRDIYIRIDGITI